MNDESSASEKYMFFHPLLQQEAHAAFVSKSRCHSELNARNSSLLKIPLDALPVNRVERKWKQKWLG